MLKKYIICGRFLLATALLAAMPILASKASSVHAQARNSISVHVFGHSRQPLADIRIELLNEYGSSVRHGRTNGAGLVVFGGIPANRYKVRALPYGTDYDEQEKEVLIENYTSSNPITGEIRTSGITNEEVEFYLRVRRGVDPSTVGVVFVQEVPPKAKKLYEQALSDLEDKKADEAFQKLKSALEIFPDYFFALDKLGTEYVRLGHYEPSVVLLRLAVKVNARSYNSWYMLAYSLHALKLYDEALKVVEKAMELNSTSANAYLLSGVLLRHAKRFDEAEKHLLKARDLSRDSIPVVHRELAVLYGYELKRYSDAVKELKAYLKGSSNPKDAEAIKNLIAEFEVKAKGS